jgi:hypothetical protein
MWSEQQLGRRGQPWPKRGGGGNDFTKILYFHKLSKLYKNEKFVYFYSTENIIEQEIFLHIKIKY